eukprot:TRINITY_DN22919_c0_g1_i1.p1 TRINITY_DN22919_c0_g1~~TRINITY_DN22919_c0_g1_i1.p1  ORF type:complete len:469 (+),score=84.62 TRINITY_DN22919_c0_g1_i1:95-1501(+)
MSYFAETEKGSEKGFLIPLMEPFVDSVDAAAPVNGESLQLFNPKDNEMIRNAVCHSFLVPNALSPPHVQIHGKGQPVSLNKNFVSKFAAAWPQQHPHIVQVCGKGVTPVAFRTSENCFSFLKLRIEEFLGQRAVQQQLFPQTRDASRQNEMVVCININNEDDIICSFDDWKQAVVEWQANCGFNFTQKRLPVPLMPAFRLDESCSSSSADEKAAALIQRELESPTRMRHNSVSLELDVDFVRCLSYHIRLMPSARSPPLYVVEDASLSHPILVNQNFLTRYVEVWTSVHDVVIWVHDASSSLLAKCRVTSEFWDYLRQRAAVLGDVMKNNPQKMITTRSGGRNVCRIGVQILTISTSKSTEQLYVYDGVWCAIIAEWDDKLTKHKESWSPIREHSFTSIKRERDVRNFQSIQRPPSLHSSVSSKQLPHSSQSPASTYTGSPHQSEYQQTDIITCSCCSPPRELERPKK